MTGSLPSEASLLLFTNRHAQRGFPRSQMSRYGSRMGATTNKKKQRVFRSFSDVFKVHAEVQVPAPHSVVSGQAGDDARP